MKISVHTIVIMLLLHGHVSAQTLENCTETPPKEAHTDTVHGEQIFIHPRHIPKGYSGCHTLWDGQGNRMSVTVIEHGKPVEMDFFYLDGKKVVCKLDEQSDAAPMEIDGIACPDFAEANSYILQFTQTETGDELPIPETQEMITTNHAAEENDGDMAISSHSNEDRTMSVYTDIDCNGQLTGFAGVTNSKGEIVIPPKFIDIGEFAANGLASASMGGFLRDKYGYINRNGEFIIPPQFESAFDFEESGLAAVRKNGRVGFINSQGKMVIPPRFYGVDFHPFGKSGKNGLASVEEVWKEGDKWVFKRGFINRRGEYAIPPRFDDAGAFAENGLANVKENKKWGFINTRGEYVIPPKFDEARSFSTNGLASVKEKGKWGIINAEGEFIVSPEFYYIRYLDNDADVFVIMERSKLGLIDNKGNMIISPRFEIGGSLTCLHNDLAPVVENKKYGFINTRGEIVIPIEFEFASCFGRDGFAMVQENGKYRHINAKGETVNLSAKKCRKRHE